jgi:hypothetical protein
VGEEDSVCLEEMSSIQEQSMNKMS